MTVRFARLALKLPAPWLLALVALITCGFGPPTLLDRDFAPTQRLTVGQLRQIQAARALPDGVTAKAALVYDVDANQIVMDHNVDQPLPPASLTKLMTALLILEESELGAQVTIQPEDQIDGATMGLQIGEILTVEQLLWGLLVPSGNDAALALARHHSGQVHVFVQRMNLRAQALGLAQTHFENPHGFDASGHASSARDLLKLTLELWQYPLFREIVGTASTTVAGHDLRSTNQLLDQSAPANGVKTGTTIAAGQCLIAGFDVDGHQLLIIVLGSQDRYADAEALYGNYRRNYTWQTAGTGPRPTALDRLFDSAGNRWFFDAQGEAPAFFLPRWEAQRLRIYRRIDPLPPAPWRPNTEVGVLEWRMGGEVVGTQRLVLR